MPNPRNYQTEAIIIKKIKLGEADRILTLFTPHLGKVRAVAKGVRRPKSKLSGHLELLTHSLVALARGRNLDTITGSQTINGFLPLKSELELTAAALYTLELVEQFTEERQENQPLFQLLLATLKRLAEDGDREMILHHFEIKLLDLTGYRPELYACLNCGKALEGVVNFFSAGAGGMLCPDCRGSHYCQPFSVDALQLLRWFQNNDYNAVLSFRPDAKLRGELKRVLRGYIQFLLEKEVKSAAFLDSLAE